MNDNLPPAPSGSHPDETPPIYLCAPVNALVEGIFEENIHLSEVLRHGDFGLGTFDDLDGEMLILDGRCYQVRADGTVCELDGHVRTPFASVTFFRPSERHELPGPMDSDRFLTWLNRLLPSPNLFYAFRIEGTFSHITARTVPRQANYHPLVDIANDQILFDFKEIEGTLAGFYTPSFMGSISVPGLHLHFLSKDGQHGGHVLTCAPHNAVTAIQIIHRMELSLPLTNDFMHWDFHRHTDEDLDKVE